MTYLETTFYGNTLQAWAIALSITVIAFLVLRVAAFFLVGRIARLAKRTKTDWDDVITAGLQRTKGIILLVFAAFFGAAPLTLPSGVKSALASLAAIALFVQAGFWVVGGISRWMELYRERRVANDAAAVMSVGAVSLMVRVGVWSLVVLVSLGNMGIDVTALVAGLGIGGVAIALASQSILGDLFASLSIVLDKPFVLGDFLIVDDHLGSVEDIGLKTTRVRSLTVFYVLGPDYTLYMDCQQAINLRIHERFEAEGIEFAYPTQTLFLVKGGGPEVTSELKGGG